MARLIDPQDASAIAVLRIRAVIFFRPYMPSGVILRRILPSGRVSTCHAAERTASITCASLTVRWLMVPCFQDR